MMMIKMMMIKSLLFLLQGFILSGFLVSLSTAGAFQVSSTGTTCGRTGVHDRPYMHTQRMTRQQQQQHQEARRAAAFDCLKSCSTLASSSTRRPLTALFATGKPKKPSSVKGQPPKEKVDGLRLFLAYATPWRNPNSIFVYMLLVLFILGKYSEAKSAAGGAL